MELFKVYSLYDLILEKAQGCYLWDDNGDKFLDLYGGHAVISIGHSHPYYIDKISQQLQKIGFYSNSVIIPQQWELAQKLGKLSDCDNYQLFLCNSGAEANENAFKIASFHTNKKKIICFNKSFHGRTSAAVAATDDKSILAPINVSDNFIFCELNNENQLQEIFSNNEIAAVIIEGIQGLGGINIPDIHFFEVIRIFCNQYNALMICDEIQSGYGRSGKFFAHQFAHIKPDLITIAKGMGNGFPIAGVLIHPDIKPKIGMLGTTFGGNHLACTAAVAVLDILENESLVQNAIEMGLFLQQELKLLQNKFLLIKDIRGLGLMIGIEFQSPCQQIRSELLERFKIFTGTSSNKNVLRILPPLNIQKIDLIYFIQALQTILSNQ
ncbi:MAG: aminotransferase class III-fold pyridoxal phosphate-dependent enzyme [Sediminibacterium sp.]|nr:aminotransferase class III-fold pyridoxal phosphate-dependent enzyme [Sediminibacterium sp.]